MSKSYENTEVAAGQVTAKTTPESNPSNTFAS
jgi:hypothetical protein